MYSGRKRISFTVCAVVCVAATYGIANSEGEPTCDTPDVKRYDGVGVKSIPRPAGPRKGRRPMAVFTVRGPDDPMYPPEEERYDTYVALSDRPFTPARVTRLRDTVIKEGLREVKRHARRLAKEAYLEGVQGNIETYVEKVGTINKLNWGTTSQRAWRYEGNALDHDLLDRYDSDWDDIHLLTWGPLALTDRGAIDIDASLDGVKKFWNNTGTDDLELAPDPPSQEAPHQLLVGRTVRFSRNVSIRVSTSKILKTFYQEQPDKWADNWMRSARYVRASVGLDFCTDILKRKYLGTDLECRYYPSGRWVVLANVQLLMY